MLKVLTIILSKMTSHCAATVHCVQTSQMPLPVPLLYFGERSHNRLL